MSFIPTAKRTVVTVAAAGLLLTTAACGSSDNSSNTASGDKSSSGGPVSMTLWTNSTTGPGLQYFQDAATAYHAANPNVTIKVQSVQNEDYDGKLQTALQAGEGSAPDIMYQRGGGKMLAMVQAGQLSEVTLSSDVQSNVSAGALSIYQPTASRTAFRSRSPPRASGTARTSSRRPASPPRRPRWPS